jgi:hypothetical protein
MGERRHVVKHGHNKSRIEELERALRPFAEAYRSNRSGEYVEDAVAVTVGDSRDPWQVAAETLESSSSAQARSEAGGIDSPAPAPANENRIAWLYRAIKRKPTEGTLAPAIKAHSQACGLVAHLLDLHPDEVAEAVAESTHPNTPRAESRGGQR